MDTETDIFPEAAERTWIHVDALRTLVRRYQSEQGELPRRLEDVTSLGDGLPLIWDGWGYRIVYSVVQGEYEIRAAGEDGKYCSSDDMLATEHDLPPYPAGPAVTPDSARGRDSNWMR
jgi:hypothetical protein